MKAKRKVTEIQVSEKELEALLIQDLSVIDPSLVLLGHQIETDTGFLDVLALSEEDNSIAVIELKVKEDDEQLFQAIRYYDWVKSRIELIGRSYKKEINVKAPPWVILVAPSFSENLEKIARYVNIDYLNLFEYAVLELPDGERYVYCREIDYGEPYESTEIPTVEGHLGYITDEKVKAVCSNALSALKDSGIEVQPRKGRKLNLLINGTIVGKIRCRQKFFKASSSLKGEWSEYYYIYAKEDWDTFLNEEIKPYI